MYGLGADTFVSYQTKESEALFATISKAFGGIKVEKTKNDDVKIKVSDFKKKIGGISFDLKKIRVIKRGEPTPFDTVAY